MKDLSLTCNSIKMEHLATYMVRVKNKNGKLCVHLKKINFYNVFRSSADPSFRDVGDIQYHIDAEKRLAHRNYAFKSLFFKPRYCRAISTMTSFSKPGIILGRLYVLYLYIYNGTKQFSDKIRRPDNSSFAFDFARDQWKANICMYNERIWQDQKEIYICCISLLIYIHSYILLGSASVCQNFF